MMRRTLPRTRQQEWHQGDIPSAFPLPLPRIARRLWPRQSRGPGEHNANGTRIGPPTLGDLRLLAKRPRRRRRERLQGFSGPLEINDTGQTRSPGLGMHTVVKPIPAKPDHRLENKNRPLKARLQTVINKDHFRKTWPG